LNHIFKQVSFV